MYCLLNIRVLVSDFELTTAVGVTTCAQVVLVLVWVCDMRGISLNNHPVSINHRINRVISLSVKLDQANSKQITIIAWQGNAVTQHEEPND